MSISVPFLNTWYQGDYRLLGKISVAFFCFSQSNCSLFKCFNSDISKTNRQNENLIELLNQQQHNQEYWNQTNGLYVNNQHQIYESNLNNNFAIKLENKADLNTNETISATNFNNLNECLAPKTLNQKFALIFENFHEKNQID